MAGMINCPYCGKLTDPKLEHCPHCRGYLQKEADESAAERQAAQRPGQTCPSCGAVVQDGDIICVACGTNLLTGQKIAEETKQRAVRERRVSPFLIGGVVALLLAVIAAAAAVYYVAGRDPVQKALELSRGRDFLAASGILNKHLDKRPDDARAHFLLGKVYWHTNQYLNAAGAFERAARLDPTNVEAGLMAVLCLASMTTQDTLARQVAILKDLAQAAPENVQAQYLLALAYGIRGNGDGQVEALRKVLELAPDHGNAQQQLGVALALRQAYAEAERELGKAQQQGANPADTIAALGFVAHLQGNAEDAAARLTASLDLEAKTSIRTEAMARLALILASQGRFNEAMPYLEEVIAKQPDIRAAKFCHALGLAARGATAEALQEFEALGQQRGGFAVEANIHAAHLCLAEGDDERAQQAIERASSFGGAGAVFETMRGRVMARTGQLRQAQTAFRKAVQDDPSYAPAHLEYGLALIRRELFDDAVPELDEYLNLVDRKDPEARTDEVQTLVDQLRQTLGEEAPPASRAGAVPERRSS